ncbi:MAG TPA: glycosyltransferase [Spirochaetota bacterium]|nr:glycosyltransferase [Spirochaetota bacterium]
MSLAPIALFTYNRLDHTRLTIEYLLKNEYASDSDLIIYSDGPKNEQAVEKVNVVRNYLKTITGFKSITIVERDANFGLAKSIITGVTEIVNRFGKIIVMEDDLVTSPYFLKYMNESLDYYEKEDKVISIHGYVYPVRAKLPETFFLVEADCWGWATWKRGWGLFESNGRKLLNTLKEKKLFKKFNYNNTYNYIKMLKDQIAGKNNS